MQEKRKGDGVSVFYHLRQEICGFFFVFSFQIASVEEDRVGEIRYFGESS